MNDGNQERDQNHNPEQHNQKHRFIGECISIFFLTLSVAALTLFLVYRPTNPQFTVAGVDIHDLNMSSPSLLSTTMQFTIVTRNHNKQVSIYYDRLTAFVLYRNQRITPQVMLPPVFHERQSTVTMSPMLGGGRAVPVSSEVVNGLVLATSQAGAVWLRVVLLGRVKWKVGSIKIGYYALGVKCDVLVGLKRGFLGPVPLLGSPTCKVDIQ